MTSLKIVGVFGIVTVLMMLITLVLPISFTRGEEAIEVNRTVKVDRLRACPRVVGPAITYGPTCK
jgi:hypothetical protein